MIKFLYNFVKMNEWMNLCDWTTTSFAIFMWNSWNFLPSKRPSQPWYCKKWVYCDEIHCCAGSNLQQKLLLLKLGSEYFALKSEVTMQDIFNCIWQRHTTGWSFISCQLWVKLSVYHANLFKSIVRVHNPSPHNYFLLSMDNICYWRVPKSWLQFIVLVFFVKC